MTHFVKTLAAGAVAAAMALPVMADTPASPAPPYTVERVTFTSGGETVIGNLFIPVGVDAANPGQATVVTGAWTTIKEHHAGLYAAELAKRGQIALAFDFRSWGESGGATRSLESPELKIEDIVSAGEFLAARPEVTRVNGLGICASAGYMATAAERSPILISVALVAPWLHDAGIVDEIYGGSAGVAELIETGRTAAAKEAETGQPQLIPAAGPAGSDALMAMDGGYYNTPGLGMIPEWDNTFNLASWEGWLTFDAIRAAPGIEQPVLIVHSDAAAIPQGARTFYADLAGVKDAVWLDDVTQFDFYHQPEPVTQASDAVVDFFAAN